MRDGVRLDVKPVAMLSDGERAELRALTAAVYPPGATADDPARRVAWAPVETSVIVRAADGDVVCHVGLVVRAGRLDDAPVTIGGVGSVKTHPRFEGRGYASAALRHGAAILREERRVAFSLLVCRDELLPFYHRLGWETFGGRLLVDQPAGRIEFTFNRSMVLAGRAPAPTEGTVDLEGRPW